LAIVTSHPIQYNAPLFRLLAERRQLDVRVFYGWEGASGSGAYDRTFGQVFAWDIPLLDGYAYEFVGNRSSDPGTHHFGGLDSPDLVPRIQTFRPDAVLVYGWASRSHLRVLRAFHGRTPVLFRGDSTLLDETPGLRRAARRIALRWVYRHVDSALYVGTQNRAYYRAHGLSESQLVWAPHAVDNARFKDLDGTDQARARAWQSKLGIPDDAPTFVFVGKLESKKSPGILLDAFLGLGIPDAHLVFVGSGPLEVLLRKQAAGAPGRIHFVGFQNQSQMPVAYRLGDVLVLPSQGPGETWGLAVNEAMACGRLCVVSDHVGCAPDLIVEGKTGHVVPAGVVGPLRDVLARLSADPAGRARMGVNALAHLGRWTLEQQADVIEAQTAAARDRPTRTAG
jgi:glycosyltransferase involved in cell wall biosynthesis